MLDCRESAKRELHALLAAAMQIYMPSAFVLTSPTDEEFFTSGSLTFTRGQDLTIAHPNGRLIVGRLVHIGWEYGRDQARVDLIGIESKRSPPYTIVDAAN